MSHLIGGTASKRTEQEPISLGGGVTLKFTQYHLEVVTGGFCFCFRPKKRIILWDTITKIDTELECWHGVIFITVTTGEVFHFECRRWKVQKAVAALYRLRGTSGPVRQARLHEDKVKVLHKHRKVVLFDEGLFLRKPTGCCSAHIKFVPWSSLISLKLTRDRKCVVARTTIQDDDLDMDGIVHTKEDENELQVAPPKTGLSTNSQDRTSSKDKAPQSHVGTALADEEFVGEGKAETEEFKEEHVEKSAELGIIHIKGSRKLSQVLFDEMVHMVGDCQSTADSFATLSTKKVTVKLALDGVHLDRSAGFFGRLEKHYVPWRSVVSLSWRPAGCSAKSLLTVHEVAGHEMDVVGASADDFENARLALRKATQEVSVVADVHPQHASGAAVGLEVSNDGVLVRTRRGLCKTKGRSFAPWARIDGIELQLNCLGIGGEASLVTESGERMRIARKSCATAPLWQVLEQVRSLKFGSDKDRGVRATFNARADARFTSKVDQQRITIASRRGFHEWDLERVVFCQAVRRQGPLKSRMVLKLVVDEGPHQQDVLQIPLLDAHDAEMAPKDAAWLASLINSLAAKRRCQTQQSSKAAAPAASRTAPDAARRAQAAQQAPQAAQQAAQPAPRPLSSGLRAQDSTAPDVFKVSLTPDDMSGSSSSYAGMKTVGRRDPKSGGNALFVEEVNAGPVAKWNERNPDKQVKPGNFIVEVNGCQDDMLNMLTALQRQERLELVVRRTWP